jgi:hypothetical protein
LLTGEPLLSQARMTTRFFVTALGGLVMSVVDFWLVAGVGFDLHQ